MYRRRNRWVDILTFRKKNPTKDRGKVLDSKKEPKKEAVKVPTLKRESRKKLVKVLDYKTRTRNGTKSKNLHRLGIARSHQGGRSQQVACSQ